MTKVKKCCIISIVGIFVLSVAGWFAFRHAETKNNTAEISVDGKIYKTVSLGVPTEFTVQTKYGYNKIKVTDNKIGVTDADCPDKVCVHTGFIGEGVVPVVCIPHRMEIRAVSARESPDAAAR